MNPLTRLLTATTWMERPQRVGRNTRQPRRQFRALSWGFTLLSALLIFAQAGLCQQDSSRPTKVLTPEQKELQREWLEWHARRQGLQAEAKQVFDAEMSREKAGDCPDANNTAESNICYGKQLDITEQNLKSFEGIIHELQIPAPNALPQPATERHGIAGPALTPEQFIAEFDSVEQIWRQYREKACTAAFHQFSGGTGGPSFEGQCELKLTRDHMRELDMIYGGDLHL